MTHVSTALPSIRPAAVRLGLLALACLLALPATAQDEWVTFVEDPSRLDVAANLGATDVEEKDYGVGDLDKDGDDDVVVVRKVPFSVAGGKANVLLMNENGTLRDRTSTKAPGFLAETDDRDVVFTDVDGDTWLDVVIAGTFDEPPRVYMNRGNSGAGN